MQYWSFSFLDERVQLIKYKILRYDNFFGNGIELKKKTLYFYIAQCISQDSPEPGFKLYKLTWVSQIECTLLYIRSLCFYDITFTVVFIGHPLIPSQFDC